MIGKYRKKRKSIFDEIDLIQFYEKLNIADLAIEKSLSKIHTFTQNFKMAILIIDNYDSFTFNLKHYVEQFDSEVIVRRNDEISLEEVGIFEKIILSPGPGLPENAGITLEVLKKYSSTKKILGVCLGHQAIAVAFGGKLKNLDEVLHGIARKTCVLKQEEKLFQNIPEHFMCGRYHSWVIDKEGLPDEIEVIAEDEQEEIMAIKHRNFNVYGVQFHPESILSEFGLELIKNWVNS